MYIQDFTLYRYKWLEILSDIQEVSVDAMNLIQVIVGANGSGKSSILNELTPLPSNKNDYQKGGYKKLTIAHNGDKYEISSNFETKAGKHSFVMNGAELNVSGLSTLQTYLCDTWLQFTQRSEDLTHCRFKMSKMSVVERKNLLLSLSPSTPDFIIQLHKQAKSELRACKNNLTLLQTRKVEIEEKLLHVDQLHSQTTLKEELDQKQVELSNQIYLLQTRIKEYKIELSSLGEIKPITEKRMHQYRVAVQKSIALAPQGAISKTYPLYIKSFEKVLECQQRKYLAQSQLYQSLQTEIAELNLTDVCLSEGADKSLLVKSVALYTDRLAVLANTGIYTFITEDQIKKHTEVAQSLYRYCDEIPPHLLKHWWRSALLGKIEAAASHVWNKYTSPLEQELSWLTKDKESYEKRLKTILRGPQTPVSACSSCDYMTTLADERADLIKRLDMINDKIPSVMKKLLKYSSIGNKLSYLVTVTRGQLKCTNAIYDILKGTIWERNHGTLVVILDGDMRGWIQHILQTLQSQPAVHERIRLEKDLLEAKLSIEAIEKADDPAVRILKKLYQTKLQQLSNIKDVVLTISEKIEKRKRQLDILHNLQKLHTAGERLQTELVSFHEYTLLNEYIHWLSNTVLSELTTEKNELDKRIFEVTQILKQQEHLKARYTEEILSLSDKVEKKQHLLTYLEMGLSPESGMPHHHVLCFINAILENVNFILSKIWTTSFRLELLQETDEITCDFKARRNNSKTLAALNKLSRSEQAGIDFAFYIALVYATGNSDYPMFFDECDDGFDTKHKQTYLEWLKSYMESQYAPQLWMVSHDAALYSGFLYKDITCLHGDNIDVPQEANRYTKFVRY